MKVSSLLRLVSRSFLLLSFLAIGNRGFAQTPIPLTVGFYYPTNGETFTAPATIAVHALVLDSTMVATVQYFANGTSIGVRTNTSDVVLTNSSTGNPFELNWSNVVAGTYALTAVAMDTGNTIVTSAPISITVTSPPPPVIRPSVYLYSPTNGSEFLAPANLTLYARAAENTGTIATVQFFANSISLGILTNGPGVQVTNSAVSTAPLFPLGWSNVLAGSYALTVVATDTLGMSSTSLVVNITVVTNFPPPPPVPFTVSFYYPTNGQTFAAPATIGVHALVLDSNLVDTVQYFANGTSIGIRTNTSGVILTNSTTGNPFELSWSNVLSGSYQLTAVALDSAGNGTTSAPITITVTNPPPPPPVHFYVTMWYPTNGEMFLAPANIGIHAQVQDSNLVDTVHYFANNISIGLVTNTSGVMLTNTTTQDSPFYMVWSNVLSGSYTLIAVATDSGGIMATSTPVTITVTNLPPPPPVHFYVTMWYPTNGETFAAPANIGVHALVQDSNLVDTVQYFANNVSIGLVTNTPGLILTNITTQDSPFYMVWSNVLAGSYTLIAVATDSGGIMATSIPVTISVTNPPPPVVRPSVYLYSPTNGSEFLAPANLTLYARAAENTGTIATVQFFANSISLGILTNGLGVQVTNTAVSTAPLFPLGWSNVLAGNYALTVVATDTLGMSSTSPVVNITVVTNFPPPPPIPFTVSFYYPTNGESFVAPATIGVHALILDSNLVDTVQYFANGTSIGIRTNTSGIILTNSTTGNPFELNWSNVTANTYQLIAVATDSVGNNATSAPITITVTAPPPPPVIPLSVGFYYPTNGQIYAAPANVGVHARVLDSTLVETVQYFANGTSIGTITNSGGVMVTNPSAYNPFFLDWSNVTAGTYALTAVVTDAGNTTVTSAPVTILVVTDLPPVVTLYAPDPVAVEGTNSTWYTPPTSATNYVSGTNTATFLVRRDSATNADLTVYYSIGGTASNGVDYATIPHQVTIPAGQSYALITIIPLDETNLTSRSYKTVILGLIEPSYSPGSLPPYLVGSPQMAGAMILEENSLPILEPMASSLAGGSVQVSLPATNGMNVSLQVSTNLVDWLPVCTNTVLKGSALYVDPNGASAPTLFYRAVPVPTPASY